jgi:flavin reductase (DIM6/NTAB) family NADH-FMN oxidoreductase RutF
MAARRPRQQPFPVEQVRRFLEPGPIVLVSSHWKGRDNVMTLGWHTVMEFTPSLVGLVIARGNHSHGMVRRSGECVINLPTLPLADTVVRIGNCSGAEVDKFERFGLTRLASTAVDAPRIAECHASFECVVHDRRLVSAYDFFVLEVVAAHAAATPRNPKTLHYTGDGRFVAAGHPFSRRHLFRPDML